MAKLQLKFRDQVVREIPVIGERITIGRTGENDIVIDNLGVSRCHAQLCKEGEEFFVEDMDSANGTLLNGKVLSSADVKKSKLQDQDEIEIGKHKLIFLLHAEITPEEVAQASVKAKGTSRQVISAEETVQVSDIKTKAYRKLTPDGLKKDVKDVGVEILEGGVDQTVVKFGRILTVAGKGPTADIRVSGDYDRDVLFVISKRPEGFFLSPPKDKDCHLKVDGKDVKDHTKLRDGQIIEAMATKMKFFISF